jgi:hypothetical protein
VDLRIKDAEKEACKELLRRLLAPVSAMAAKLGETPKGKRDDITFRDSLVGNLQDIARIAPALNITEDPAIDAFIREVDTLAKHSPKVLREDRAIRAEVQKKADELTKRLSGYTF